ncbi:uncharacterized protein LOC111684173 [Lucilia cuprina]|uniref:uncharacterized protein LOC111684173 n=1 Tax=Lucilia cuprina TaxID=7375 RepID=UPI001F06F81A|nr:uncharacterized protein LOC111684173 [Lucilia cuprina]
MDILDNFEPKPKRVCLNPPRKWSVAEEKSLLEFLVENRDFEKPTAQVYYKRFAEQKNVCVEWKQVRSKVRNMRVSYNKAKAWEGSTGAGSMEGETVKATLLKMCCYYDELDDIFGSKIIETAVIEESLDEESDGSFLNSTEIYVDDTTTASDSSLPET